MTNLLSDFEINYDKLFIDTFLKDDFTYLKECLNDPEFNPNHIFHYIDGKIEVEGLTEEQISDKMNDYSGYLIPLALIFHLIEDPFNMKDRKALAEIITKIVCNDKSYDFDIKDNSGMSFFNWLSFLNRQLRGESLPPDAFPVEPKNASKNENRLFLLFLENIILYNRLQNNMSNTTAIMALSTKEERTIFKSSISYFKETKKPLSTVGEKRKSPDN